MACRVGSKSGSSSSWNGTRGGIIGTGGSTRNLSYSSVLQSTSGSRSFDFDKNLSDPVLTYHGTTTAKTTKCHYVSNISNYGFIKNRTRPIESPKFPTRDGSQWHLRLHPLGDDADLPERKFISASLHGSQLAEKRVQVKKAGTILTWDEDSREAVKTLREEAEMAAITRTTGWIYTNSFPRADLFDEEKKFLRDGSIRILWSLEILVGVENSIKDVGGLRPYSIPCKPTMNEDTRLVFGMRKDDVIYVKARQ